MARLTLSLLGPFQVLVDGDPVVGFSTAKVRALLAYLAAEADRPHTREALAALLWPDWPGRHALSNLRQALANLRATIHDRAPDDASPHLLVSRETVQFNRASDHALDVAAFEQQMREAGPGVPRAGADEEARIATLLACVRLYRGPFLDGLAIDSAPYEEWVTPQREHWQREVLGALEQLAELYEKRGDYPQAEGSARRALAIEPTDERWQRQLMRALALGGQRNAALAQYEACRRVLAEELGVEPAPETTALHEQIRRGVLVTPPQVTTAPTPGLFARGDPGSRALESPALLGAESPRPLFVARERELAQLEQWLSQALRGQGGVGFVVGEPGSGKTMLLREFAYRAMQAHPDLVVASGSCNAYAGIGDPYLPFVESLRLLVGDVEALCAVGSLRCEHAQNLRLVAPEAIRAVLQVGPAMIDVLLAGSVLLEQAGRLPDGATWVARVQEVLDHRALAPSQAFLFDQATHVLQTVAQSHPLILILDDLQWADTASISLLFHLGRRTTGHRLLVLGAYRPEEVASGQEGRPHPLQAVLREMQRIWGKMQVDLDQAQGEGFLQALIDSEPNRLEALFRQALYQRTGGHALFTVELLRGLQERGDLLQDSEGRWMAGPSLDWDALPERVEAVIAERIERLPRELQELLSMASVEGEEFHAEVAARALRMDEGQALAWLSGPLSQEHHMVRAHSRRQVDAQSFSRYRFQHYLFQHYLYQRMDPVQRAHRHAQVAQALEALGAAPSGAPDALHSPEHLADDYSDLFTSPEPVVSEATMARHWEQAGLTEKAIRWHSHAVRRASWLGFAYDGELRHSQKMLDLLNTLPQGPQRTRYEYLVHQSLANGLAGEGGYAAPGVEEALRRSLQSAEQTGDALAVADALFALAHCQRMRGELDEALSLIQRAVSLAQGGPPGWVASVQGQMAMIQLYRGDFASGAHLLAPLSDLLRTTGSLPPWATMEHLNLLEHLAWALWCQGYPDQAIRVCRELLDVVLAEKHRFASSTAMVLCGATCFVHQMRREVEGVGEGLRMLLPLLERGLSSPIWRPLAVFYQGWIHACNGLLDQGITELRAGLAKLSGEAVAEMPYLHGYLVEAQTRAALLGEGWSLVEAMLAQVERSNERWSEAELWRLKGDLLAEKARRDGDSGAQGRDEDATASSPAEGRFRAESCLRRAIDIAREQAARSWELRAATSLARFLGEQGRRDEAREWLAPIYSWFTEGLNTPDLLDARALLDELA